MIKHNLIRLGDSDTCIVSNCMFIFFVFLTFGELYKYYLNSLCVSQKFKIRKIVSTRYDLSHPICNEKYFKFNPQMDLILNTYIFKPQDFNYLNNFHHPILPTKEEIEAAQKYQDKPGVILDLLGVDNEIRPIREIKDINKGEENKVDDSTGINIQMVGKYIQEDVE